ncbi:hypothetical protein PC122_g23939 [Phytophthora cactorum]|nr:hypothetical protein PC122_g23939 [Phytophthora cactorum]
MRQDLLQTVNHAQEPLRKSARPLVLEIAAITERQLEARMQKAITNTQSELNLEVQRQADATSSLREQVRKQGIRINKQSKQARQQGDAGLEATIAEMVQKEVQECLNAVQETRKIIDRSIQSAVDVICKTIKDEVREVTAKAAQPKPQVSSVIHGNATKDDKSDGDDEDHELERRMQEAWRKTYLVDSSSVFQPEASTDQEPSKEILQSSTCSTDNESSGEIIAASPRSSAHREVDREMETEEKLPTPQEVTIVLQESSTPVVGGVVLTQPNQAQEHTQQQTHSPWHDEPQPERVRNTPFTPTVPSATTQTPATGSCQGSVGDRKSIHPEATVPLGRGNVFTQSMDSMSACVAMQRRTLRTDSTIFVCFTRSGTSRSRASTLAS